MQNPASTNNDGSNTMKYAPNTFNVLRMSAGIFGIDIIWGLLLAMAVPYAEYLGMSLQDAQVMMIGAPVTAVILQPWVGAASDTCTYKMGPRRPFILFGTIATLIAAVFYIIAPYVPAEIAFGVLGFTLLTAAVNIMQGPYRAYVSDVLPDSSKTKGQTICGVMMAAGSVIANLVIFVLPNPVSDVPYLFAGACVLVIITCIISMLARKEEPLLLDIDQDPSCCESFKKPWIDMYHGIKTINKPMLIVLIVHLFLWMAMMQYIPFLTTYFTTVILNAQPGSSEYDHGVRLGALATIFQSVVQFIFPLVVLRLVRTNMVMLKYTWIFSLVVLVLSCVGLALVPSTTTFQGSEYIAITLLALNGIPKGFAFVAPFAYVVKLAKGSHVCMLLGVINAGISLANLIDLSYASVITATWTMRGNFWVAAGFGILSLIASFWLPSRREPEAIIEMEEKSFPIDL